MKQKDEEQRAKAKEQRAKSKGKGSFIDWRQLDVGVPGIPFVPPSKKEHTRICKILAREDAATNPEAKRIRNQLGTKFALQYERYRKQKTGGSGWMMTNGEFEHAVEAAVMCYTRGVTPVALLRYWDVAIKHWHNPMKYPSLTFLKSAHAVDKVAVEKVDSRGRPVEAKKPEAIETHGFSDLSKLDRRIRPALKEAGFKVEQYKDDVMLVIQKTAGPIKRGFSVGLPVEIAKMSKYIAEHHVEIDEDDKVNFVFDGEDGYED